MTTMLSRDLPGWAQLATDVLQQRSYDDVAAAFAFLLATVAYTTRGALWARPDPHAWKLYERPQQAKGALQATQQSTDIARRLENADVAILWASQSGTAERLAGRLSKELRMHFGVKVLLLDISDIEAASCSQIPETKLTIFLASTFGEGDPSDNLHDYWTWIHAAKEGVLRNLRYIAFGLGNSNYKYYNHVVDVLVSQMQAHGAQALMETGKADDANGETEEHFLAWKEQVCNLFATKLGYARQEPQYEPSLAVDTDDSLEPQDLHWGEPTPGKLDKSSASSDIYSIPISQTQELFQDASDRCCLHMELNINRLPQLKYKTGDYLDVWPLNPSAEVACLLRAFGKESERERPIHVKSLDGTAVKVPSPTTLEAIFASYLEICAPVSRELVSRLATFAPDQGAKDFLAKLGRDKVAYTQHLSSNYVNLGRLLEGACALPGAWSGIPLAFVIESLPTMKPRPYSISSSSVVSPRQVCITAVVADTHLGDSGNRVLGLATNYLQYAKEGSHPRGLTYAFPQTSQTPQSGHVFARVRKSNFKLPTVASAPILMVGAGTGLAPFRGFIQERARLAVMGRDVGKTKLFFGCRNPAQDLIYAEDFAKAGEELGPSFSVTNAFSRPDAPGRNQYVQDAMREQADAVAEQLVDNNAYFYICGSASMARCVADAVRDILRLEKGWDEATVEAFAEQQKRQKRWQQDVWG
ncbi:hypothetical protein MBLNU230_g2345t1 [Neophaeotheca triangularis]